MLEVSFETGNADFEADSVAGGYMACARILRDLAAKLEDGYEGGAIFDGNGNRIGSWEVSK